MRKSYIILLMLLTVALSASATKRTRIYDFAYNSNDYNGGANDREFKWTSFTYVNSILGYQNRTGQQYKTETIVDGYDHRFAFYTTRWHWRTGARQNFQGNDNQYLKNDVDAVNLFSVLNLRAGDIVRIKCNDNRTDLTMKNRFITLFSSNAIDNRPWGSGDDVYNWLKTAYHEFIMKEDGNLDLNCAPYLEIVNVEVISPFADFQYKTVTHEQFASGVLETNDIYINPWNKDRGDDGDPKIVWQEWQQPIVLVRGDLEGTPVATKIPGNAQYSNRVRVTGLSGRGGTVIVMLERCMYTFTIPYKVADGSKAWNFWSSPLAVGRSTENGTQGPDKLSLQFHDQAYGISKREWYHNTNSGDIYTTLYDEWMNGQNAYVNEETAGLIFFSDTNGDTETPSGQYQDGGWQRRTYGYENETPVEDGDGKRYITVRKHGGFIIPDLEKGDQVYIYMAHSINGAKGIQLDNGQYKDGVKFTVTNALDALKNPITSAVATGGSNWGPSIGDGNWGRQYYGAIHLYAANKGDMKFTADGYEDKDFIKLCYIRIYRNNQDIIINTDEMVSNTGGYEILIRQNADGTFEDSELHTLELRTTQTVSSNQRFEVLECSGNLNMNEVNSWGTAENRGRKTNPWIYNININTKANGFTPKYGAYLVRGKDYDHNNRYCVNYADRVIAVGTLQQMNYPFTWDFKDILGRGASGAKFDADAAETTAYQDSTRIWTKNGSIYEINNSAFANGNRNWSSGAQLYASNEYIEEAAGVGFATWNQGGSNGGGSHNGDISITSEGVKIMPQHQYGMTRVFVPNVPKPETNKPVRLYLQGKRYVGGTSGFGASYLTGRAKGPRINNPWNTKYRDNSNGLNDTGWSTDPLLKDKIKNINIVLGESTDEIEYDNFAYNFTTLDLEQGEKKENVVVDNHLTILATTDKSIEIAQGAPSTVNNAAGLQQFGSQETNAYGTVIKDQDGNILSEYDEYGNHITYGATDKNGNLIYDSNNVSLVTNDDITYVNIVKLGGAGSSSSRALKVTGLNASSSYTVRIALKSGNSSENRQLKIYGGDSWGSNELATMLARDKVMEKQITVSGTSTLFIGSASSGIEIYAVYVEESHETTAVKAVPFLAYIDMADAEFYGQSAINVTLYLSDVMLERMAVTTDKKELNKIGWASESRNHYIDHRLNEAFNNVPVKAYLATGTVTNQSTNLINGVTLTELTKPMELSEGNQTMDPDTYGSTFKGLGCILHNANNEGVEGNAIYLFVPAIQDYLKSSVITNANFKGDVCTNGCPNSENATSPTYADPTKLNSMADNMMIANLDGTKVEYSNVNDPYLNYVLTYNYIDGSGNSHGEGYEPQSEWKERFVRVGKGGANGKANTAYLCLPVGDVKPEGWNGESNLLILFEGEDEIDGIEEINLKSIEDNVSGTDTYYNLSGQKVNTPNKPGIYVKNGKKVYVK